MLKYYGAATIPGTVTRLIPRRTDELENRIYYEFLDFYKQTRINYIWFSRIGSFAKLQKAVCKASSEVWSDEDRRSFLSFYTSFRSQFELLNSEALNLTPADAMLVYLSFYRYSDAMNHIKPEIHTNLLKIWDEVKVLTEHRAVELKLEPQTKPTEASLLEKLVPTLTQRPPLQIAFLHEDSAHASAWTRAHGEGRLAMKRTFGPQVEVHHYNNITPGVDDMARMDEIIRRGAEVIFTTSSLMMPACLKTAALHPQVKILNCSVNVPHPSVRSYYPRMYEAKYLLGMLAGIISPSDTVGYAANYPIYGVPASINAFALGLRAVRPQGKVCVRWACLDGADGCIDFSDRPDIALISGRDQSTLTDAGQDPGIVLRTAAGTQTIAQPVWRWDVIYNDIVRAILDGTWESEEADTRRAINYWWGMKSRAVAVRYVAELPAGTLQLLKLAGQQIAAGQLDPFAGELYNQSGAMVKAADAHPGGRQLLRMNWLMDNVEGRLPDADEAANPTVRRLIELQGVNSAPTDREEEQT